MFEAQVLIMKKIKYSIIQGNATNTKADKQKTKVR